MRVVQPGAGLYYQGEEPGPYRDNYFKQTHAALDDWSDLIALTRVLSESAAADIYNQRVAEILDVDQWLRTLAMNSLVANNETTLATGDEDDYFLYNPFPAAPHFLLITHDLDTILGMGDRPGSATDNLFRMTGVPTMARFMQDPLFYQRYREILLDLADSLLSESAFGVVLRQTLGGKVPDAVLDQMEDFMARRLAYIRDTL
jgi:hypothetical protein